MNAEADAKTCFVLMPFGGEFDRCYRRVIAPAIAAVGLQPVRADELHQPGLIFAQIWEAIRDSSVCVAELTGLNSNVMYELGLAHALGKPVAQIVQDVRELPFDLRSLRCIPYKPDGLDWEDTLRENLEQMLRTILIGSGSAFSLFPGNASELAKEIKSLHQVISSTTNDVTPSKIGLSSSFYSLPGTMDYQHHYYEVCRDDILDLESGTFSSARRLKGVNAKESMSSYLIYQESNGTNLPYSRLDIEATDVKSDERLRCSTFGYPANEPRSRHAFCIYFRQPLEQRDEFDITYSIHVPGEAKITERKNLTMSINLIRCQAGVDRLNFSIRLPVTPKNYYVTKEYESGEIKFCPDINIVGRPTTGGGIELRVIVDGPELVAYIFNDDMPD